MRIALCSLALLIGGCVIEVPREAPPPVPVADEPAPPPAESVYEEPPVGEPAPIAVAWAPPPMLVEVPPPAPFPYAVWVGGYWVWQGNWVWAHGHWMEPPRPQYLWVHPYYEHRGDLVIFVNGHWAAPGVVFVPPAPGVELVVEPAAFGVVAGPRPIGPEGCFVPAPPGSRRGIIIPAPLGTAPAVMTSAPPVVAVGMRVTNNVTNIHNTNITNVTNVTIVAPPGATASGRAFNTAVPAAPHLAAARPALVQARAPEPASTRPVPAYVPARAAMPAAAANSAPHPPGDFARVAPPRELQPLREAPPARPALSSQQGPPAQPAGAPGSAAIESHAGRGDDAPVPAARRVPAVRAAPPAAASAPPKPAPARPAQATGARPAGQSKAGDVAHAEAKPRKPEAKTEPHKAREDGKREKDGAPER